MKTKIFGTYTVLVTPFHEDHSLDEEGLIQNIRYQISQGIKGIVTLGTTSEAPTLSEDEKKRVVSIVREETFGRCHCMIGTGTYSTQETIKNTWMAKEAGADSVLVVTPYYNKPTQEGLFQHYQAIAKAVQIPIVIYNIQGRTGINMSTETLKRLATIENIVGVKEASGNIHQMMDVIENILPMRPDFSIMSGDDALTYPLMTLGGHGVYSVLSNLLPQPMDHLCNALIKGDYKQAQELHFKLLPLMKGIFIETNPIPIKAALQMVGFAAGPCRLPLSEISKENFEILKKQLKNDSLLNQQLLANSNIQNIL